MAVTVAWAQAPEKGTQGPPPKAKTECSAKPECTPGANADQKCCGPACACTEDNQTCSCTKPGECHAACAKPEDGKCKGKPGECSEACAKPENCKGPKAKPGECKESCQGKNVESGSCEE